MEIIFLDFVKKIVSFFNLHDTMIFYTPKKTADKNIQNIIRRFIEDFGG